MTTQQPAWVLSRKAYGDNGLLVEFFDFHHNYLLIFHHKPLLETDENEFFYTSKVE